MYHEFSIGQSILSSFGLCTITDHIPGNVWGYEVTRRDGRMAWLSADEMTPLSINIGDAICARHNNGSEYIGIVTRTEGGVVALFAEGEFTVALSRIQWVVAVETAQIA